MLNETDEQRHSRLSLSTLLDIVAPVLQQFILEGKAAEDSGHEIKQVTATEVGNSGFSKFSTGYVLVSVRV